MIFKKKLLILLIILFFSSCYGSLDEVSVKDKNLIKKLNENIKTLDILGVNDLIEVKVYGESKFTRIYRINTEGFIVYPVAGRVKALNRSIYDVSKEIENKLKLNLFKDPHVTIFLKESNSKKVYILGQIKKPGAYSYKYKITLLKLIATSGGLTRVADIDKIILKREIKGEIKSITIKASLIINGELDDLLLSPEDIIYVSESWL